MAERFGIYAEDKMPKSFAGLARAQNLAEERKTHWRIERHGGQRKNHWRHIWSGPAKEAQRFYSSIRTGLTDWRDGKGCRGGVRLVDPDGHIDCEFIKSPWLKEAEGARSNAAV